MQQNLYILPVKRYGNEYNPKLVILLLNPGDSTEFPKRLPDYTMNNEGVYKDSGNSITVLREYNKWFDDFYTVFINNDLRESDVLMLEYYPYHTANMSEIPNKSDWTKYAKESLIENKELLHKFISQNIPVFGYYYSHWVQDIPQLKEYSLFYPSKKRFKKQKCSELHTFLQKVNKK